MSGELVAKLIEETELEVFRFTGSFFEDLKHTMTALCRALNRSKTLKHVEIDSIYVPAEALTELGKEQGRLS